MKLAILGAAGVRTPLVLSSILARREPIGLTELALMDIDGGRLALMRALCEALLGADPALKIIWTQDARAAIRGADFVITTFRVGGMESRVIDEQVPLRYGVLGQETTGPGGFAMGLRTIPVALEYVRLLREETDNAWLLNFTNPAGMVTEAITSIGGYARAVGICDNPSAMTREAARLLGVPPADLLVEYFGLNHLGWVRSIVHQGQDRLSELLDLVAHHSGEPLLGLPFEPEFIRLLGLLPNEYNYFYTNTAQAVGNLRQAGLSRAGQIMPLNIELYETLDHLRQEPDASAPMKAAYLEYLARRESSYMSIETGHRHVIEQSGADPLAASAEGYAGVALGVIAALGRPSGALSILNVPNRGAIQGMGDEDVVELTCRVGHGAIRPLAVGRVPGHALGLMQLVKEYERLTIRAAVEGSYDLALKALALHPLVPSTAVARSILDGYLREHGAYFPALS